MAMLPPNQPWGQVPLDFDPSKVEVQEYAIGGKMVTVRMEITDANLVNMPDEDWRRHIRNELAHRLAAYILEAGLCETTTFLNPNGLSRTVAIRCFLTPSDQVRLLRVHRS